jgi:hypothetical protein
MKAELYVHLMELITESERHAENHPDAFMRETYRNQANVLRATLLRYEETGEDSRWMRASAAAPEQS